MNDRLHPSTSTRGLFLAFLALAFSACTAFAEVPEISPDVALPHVHPEEWPSPTGPGDVAGVDPKAPAETPEPATWVLGASAGLWLAWRRRQQVGQRPA